MNAKTLLTLTGMLLILTLTSTSTAAYSYYSGYTTATPYPARTSPYGFYPQVPTFNAYESRPSGYGLVRTTTPYPRSTPRYDNNLFLGHTSPWSYGTYYSALTGNTRTYGAYRTKSNYHIPSRPYDPYHYYREW